MSQPRVCWTYIEATDPPRRSPVVSNHSHTHGRRVVAGIAALSHTHIKDAEYIRFHSFSQNFTNWVGSHNPSDNDSIHLFCFRIVPLTQRPETSVNWSTALKYSLYSLLHFLSHSSPALRSVLRSRVIYAVASIPSFAASSLIEAWLFFIIAWKISSPDHTNDFFNDVSIIVSAHHFIADFAMAFPPHFMAADNEANTGAPVPAVAKVPIPKATSIRPYWANIVSDILSTKESLSFVRVVRSPKYDL